MASMFISPTGRRRQVAIVFYTFTLATFYSATSVPTPLYRLYQEAFGFTALMTTVIFAVYSLSLLLTLLLVGSISDYLGRRPVVFASLILLVCATTLFLFAQSPAWLLAARIVQGVAIGAAASATGAALIDLDPMRGAVTNSVAPLVGMAIGALATSTLVQLAPYPLHLTHLLVLSMVLAQAALIHAMPETARRRRVTLAELKPRISLPHQVRRHFIGLTPLTIAVWMLAGFYLSLVPSLVVVATGNQAPIVGGAVVGALTLSGSTIIYLCRNQGPGPLLRTGPLAMLSGVMLVFVGVHIASASLLVVATLIAGVGFGANFLGVVKAIIPLAAAGERAGLLAAFYIECYLASSLPTIALGLIARQFGLVLASDMYGAAVVLMIDDASKALRVCTL